MYHVPCITLTLTMNHPFMVHHHFTTHQEEGSTHTSYMIHMYLPARESPAGHRDAPRWGIPFIRREIDTLSCLLLPVSACFCLSFLPSLTPPSFPLSSHRSLFCSSLSSSSSSSSSLSPPSIHPFSSSLQHRKHHALTEQRVRPLPSQNRAFRSIGLSICCIRSHYIRHISIKHTFIIQHHIQAPTHQRHHQPNVCSCCHPTRRFRAITSEWIGIRSVCQAWISVQTPLILLTLPSRSKTLQRALT